MIPGMLIQVKPYKFFNAFYLLLTPEEHQKRKTGFENILKMDPGMICLVLGKEKYNGDVYCKLLIGDRICYMHGSLYNQTNFQVVRSEAA